MELIKTQLELFFIKHHPTNLKDLMARFNRQYVHCRCVACFDAKRCETPSLSQIPAHTCVFAPTWEGVLNKYCITFEYRPIDPTDEEAMARITHPVNGPQVSSRAMLVQVRPLRCFFVP